MSGKGRKMDPIRNACKVSVWEVWNQQCKKSGLCLGEAPGKASENQSIENRDCRETERKGNTLGTWKDS